MTGEDSHGVIHTSVSLYICQCACLVALSYRAQRVPRSLLSVIQTRSFAQGSSTQHRHLINMTDACAETKCPHGKDVAVCDAERTWRPCPALADDTLGQRSELGRRWQARMLGSRSQSTRTTSIASSDATLDHHFW